MSSSAPASSGLCPAQQVFPRIGVPDRFPERLQRLARLVAQLLRHLHLHGDQQVAYGAVLAPDALAANPEGPAVRGACRNADIHRHGAMGRYLDLRAEGGLGKGNGHGDRQVVARPAEYLIRTHVHPYVEVAGRTAALAGCALALELDPLAVANTGRNAGLDGPGTHRAAAARAHLARVVDHEAAPPAGPARLRKREVPQVLAGLPAALAGGADPRHGSRLGAGAHAGLARPLAGQPQGHGDAVDRVPEGQGRLGLDVRAAPRPRLLVRAAAEHPAEKVAEPPAGAPWRAAEEVTEVEPALAAARRSRHPDAAAAEQGPGVVVLLAPLLVRQHVVRLGDLLEALLGRRVALVGIGVVLAGELAVRLLDLVGRRVLGDAEDLVEVLLEEVLGAHGLSSPVSVWVACARGTVACAGNTAVGRRAGFLRAPGAGIGRICGLAAVIRLGYVTGLGHGNPGRAQDPVPDLVARLQDAHARRLGHVRGVGVHECLMQIRVERVAGLPVARPAELGGGRLGRLGHRLDPACQFLVLPGPADVVQYRQQLAEHRRQRLLPDRDPVPLDPLAVVGVLGLQALQVSRPLGEPRQRGSRLVVVGRPVAGKVRCYRRAGRSPLAAQLVTAARCRRRSAGRAARL